MGMVGAFPGGVRTATMGRGSAPADHLCQPGKMRMRAIIGSSRGRSARLLVALLSAFALVTLLAGPAWAGRYVDRAAAGLRRDRVYVDPAARKVLPAAKVRAIRGRVGRVEPPVLVAVLPAAALREAGGSADKLAQAIVAALRGGGTVAVDAGGRVGAASSTLDPGVAGSTVHAANQAHRGDPAGAILDFVGRADTAASGDSFWRTVWDQPYVRPIALIVGLLLLIILVDLVVVSMFRRRSSGKNSGFGDVQALAREDIVALGDDLRNLESGLDAENDQHPQAIRDYTRAHESFQQAVEAFERAQDPNDFAPVSTALESGRYYMTLARARFEGRELPQRRPPCFFDTRHGPSVDDVGWMPSGGPPRPVPACESCMWSIANGVEPPARQVVVGGRRMAFYDAPPHFESWFAGYFGGAAAGLVDGFPLGRALDDGYAGGLNTFGGGYGYLPVSYADTGVLDPGGADIGHRQPGADTELVIRPAGYDADTEG
jgi:hypothetical protein